MVFLTYIGITLAVIFVWGLFTFLTELYIANKLYGSLWSIFWPAFWVVFLVVLTFQTPAYLISKANEKIKKYKANKLLKQELETVEKRKSK